MRLPVLLCWFALVACSGKEAPFADLTPAEQYQSQCANCHLATDPTLAPRDVWRESLLPRMGVYLGLGFAGTGIGMEEQSQLLLSGTVPTQARVDTATWRAIRQYVLNLAPAAAPVDSSRSARNEKLALLRSRSLSGLGDEPAIITGLNWDERAGTFRIGTYGGVTLTWPEKEPAPLATLAFPVSQQVRVGEALYVLEVGEFNPSETDYGILHHYGPEGSHDTLATGLRRAVDLQVADLDGDDRPEFILCEYGNLRGRLTLLTKGEKVSLLDVPGAIRTQVSDLNGDGRPDIVALVAQGDEGVYILYQTENGGFHPQRVLRLPPIYGTSWFELLDYDGDGDQDLVVVNGDNADYSNFLKPYHGLRLYLNDGQNAFTEAAFIPLYGATRVVAHDFDEDGDYDFAVTAYFPDWEREPAAGFVYLENVESADYDFRLRTTPAAANGRWLVLEKGDYDGDGDMDVALGNFPLFPGRQYPGVAEGWREAGVELLLMENTLR